MLALRAIPLLVLFSGQVVAGGLGAAEHQCRAKASRSACACKKAPRVDAPVALKAPPCCTNHFTRSEPPDGRSEAARAMPERLDVAQPFAALALAPPAGACARLEPLAEPRPPEHGPPLFVKQRSLLL
jgi:hypothetical protein